MSGKQGDTFGPYLIVRLLGTGGAGDVYLAETNDTGSVPQVALKVLSGRASDTTTREIARQVQVAGALQQPHVIPLYGVVEESGRLAVAMAFAPGGSLGDALRGRETESGRRLTLPLPAGVVARLFSQLAQALQAAHDAGLVHGDVKPDNIFVRTSPVGHPLAVISDFGQSVLSTAAARISPSDASFTSEQRAWAATQLLYAAPEQLRGETVPSSDQYSLASVIYLLLTGRNVYSGSAADLKHALTSVQPVPPSQLLPEISPAVDGVLMRALQQSPDRRYASVSEFARALEEVLAVPAGSGVTQSFMRLAGERTEGRGGTPQGVPLAGGTLTYMGQSGASGGSHVANQSTLADPPARTNRRLAMVAGVAVVIAVAACSLVFRAFTGAAILPQIQLGTGGAGVTQYNGPVNAQATAASTNAMSLFRSATAGQPVVRDPLSSNTAHWQTAANAVFFNQNVLHVANPNGTTGTGADVPGSGTWTHVAVQVSMTVERGHASDLAGVRFFVLPQPGGTETYYAYLINSGGQYEVWYHRNSGWTTVASGYSNALNTGIGNANTLAVLADGNSNQALLFANGQFIAQTTLASGGPTSGNVGLMVLDTGVQARFSHLAVYNVAGQ